MSLFASNRILQFGGPILITLLTSSLVAQQTTARRTLRRARFKSAPWAVSLLVDGYYVPDEQGYVDPIITADRSWLHLEGRYNYEDLRTGSFWLGYNYSLSSSPLDASKKVDFTITPMVGGVFGQTTGVAPGCEASITYRKFNFWVSNEYVFNTNDSSANYFYTWHQLTYSPTDWIHVGLVAQRTLAIQNDRQLGFLAGFSAKKTDFTAYILNFGTTPTVILEIGYNF